MENHVDTAALRPAGVPALSVDPLHAVRRFVGSRCLGLGLSPWILAAEWLPPGARVALWQGLAKGIVCAAPSLRRRALQNIDAVFGGRLSTEEKTRLCDAAFDRFAANASDTPRLRRMSREELGSLVDLRGGERLASAAAAGRGVVGVAPHTGNWELLACALAARGLPVTVVAARLCDPRLGRYVARVRSRWGVRTIERDAPGASRAALRVLARGEILGTLMDLHTRRDAIVAPFLGRPSRVPAGPARLALRTGATLLPIWIRRANGGRYVAQVEEPIRIAEDVPHDAAVEMAGRRAAEVLSRVVLEHPEEWLWAHERWPVAEAAR